MIDTWIRKNSDKKFDEEGRLALLGKKNEIILEQAQELYSNRKDKSKVSFDTNDFDISFARGLSLEDGVATLTDFTASIISDALSMIFEKEKNIKNILVCGGGRKNKVLIELINKKLIYPKKLNPIDKYNSDGDFIESQAFAFLAIRSFIGLPITFPNTTNCKKPTLGGDIIKTK